MYEECFICVTVTLLIVHSSYNLFIFYFFTSSKLLPGHGILFPFPRTPVSHFSQDSIYAAQPPSVDKASREVFERHIQTGQGLVGTLHRGDVLMYREYIKNRYM